MILCVFDGHIHRVGICQGEATSFLRTPQGLLWPFCTACADRQKRLVAEMVGSQITVGDLEATIFDIPINDVQALEQFQAQDPEPIRVVLARAEAMHAELLDDS